MKKHVSKFWVFTVFQLFSDVTTPVCEIKFISFFIYLFRQWEEIQWFKGSRLKIMFKLYIKVIIQNYGFLYPYNS